MWRVHIYASDDLDTSLCGHQGGRRRQPTPGEMHAWEAYCPPCVAALASMTEDLAAALDTARMSTQQATLVQLRTRRTP